MFTKILEKLNRRCDLTSDEAGAVMALIMDGKATAAQIGGLLVGLAMKGERPNEIVGLARTMRTHTVKLQETYTGSFDTCGTGGDRSNTFNISSVAALVLAACGVTVAKHGNRSVSSKCGSADLFEEMGVKIDADPVQVEQCLREAGIAFFFAPKFHPSMRHAAQARKDLGIRTAFNLLGPLTNPAGARRQLVGVSRPEHTELLAHSFALLGSERAWVVHGADGLDEISTTGYTKVSECREGVVNTFYLHPDDFGCPKVDLASLKGGDAERNSLIAERVLGGEKSAARDIVLLNASAGLLITGEVSSLKHGFERAAEAIDTGAAKETLHKLTTISRLTSHREQG